MRAKRQTLDIKLFLRAYKLIKINLFLGIRT